MKAAPAKYYLTRRLDNGKPLVLYRIYLDTSKIPEAISKMHGWQADRDILWLNVSGEIGSADLISEEDASAIARSWGSAL
jgi:hypothetical protein